MKAQKKILLVEDEKNIREQIVIALEREGFSVVSSENGNQGFSAFKKEPPDLLILDLLMPGMDGFEVCREVRKISLTTPIIILTAKKDDIDKVLGLELGADDYLTKPFNMRELLARIKAIFRRCEIPHETGNGSEGSAVQLEDIGFGDVELNFNLYQVYKSGTEISMSIKEFEIVKYLIMNKGKPIARDELLNEIWGYDSYPSTRTVDNFIARIRQKLEDAPKSPRYFVTVHGLGYKFIE